jgi:hypothetical protein
MGFYRITGTREIVDGIYETPERIYLCADAFLGATAEGLECHRTHQAAAADVTVVTPAMLTSAIDALEANRDKLEGLLLAMEASEDDAYSEERDGDIW